MIRDAARAFITDREWDRYQDPKSVLLALMGEVGELAELLQWLPADEVTELVQHEPLRSRVTQELADVFIYLVGLADQCRIDLGSAALAKIEAASRKYPVEEVRGIAPDRSRS